MKHLRIEEAVLPPTWDHPSLDKFEITDSQKEWLEEHSDSLTGDNSGHQMGSYASSVQDADMEMKCQLASNGLYLGDA